MVLCSNTINIKIISALGHKDHSHFMCRSQPLPRIANKEGICSCINKHTQLTFKQGTFNLLTST
eukprot:m.49705 g.49705  ORF g.49705 m.49705 type:complete len:64 (+) comp7464_c2_seq11:619-810(+)